MKFRMAVAGLALHAAATAAAPSTVEELAAIGAAEEAKLDKLGIVRSGDGVRFDVAVTRRDSAQRPQGEPAARTVRYLGRCATKTLALSSVTTSDEYGKALKRYLVPPGGAQFSPPQPGSREAQWLDQACAVN